jgi:hypothetical protein
MEMEGFRATVGQLSPVDRDPGNDSSIGYRKENVVQPLIVNLGPGNALWTLEQGSIVQLHGGR